MMWWSRMLMITSGLIACTVLNAKGQYFGVDDGLDTLGQRISASVNEQLRPLQHLGSRINNQVAKQVSGLENLDSQISQSVYQGLEPVRAMEIMFKMIDGVGGTTITTYYPSGKKLIVMNHQRYICEGTVNQSTGECNGNLKYFHIQNQKDWCYGPTRSYTHINDYICLSVGNIFVQVINDRVTCQSTDNSSILFLKREDYQNLCRDQASQVEVKYIANENDPSHVEIPNKNPHVRCSNNEKGVCIFTQKTSFDNINTGNVVNNYGSSLFYNN
ncbi:uncharacterized protein LOC132708467 [Cylas formicarius]|uniref:uncharacterized protein LOC132708467 n=1 Tax=Cylas formicarius TaxID=197179 RepID=UPI00295854E1|nr:uncharacterized protein LOC132708467 [Cylas formicarius]